MERKGIEEEDQPFLALFSGGGNREEKGRMISIGTTGRSIGGSLRKIRERVSRFMWGGYPWELAKGGGSGRVPEGEEGGKVEGF